MRFAAPDPGGVPIPPNLEQCETRISEPTRPLARLPGADDMAVWSERSQLRAL
jgi:hypothetical protein